MDTPSKGKSSGVIFRRYIRRKNGRIDDAWAHGLKAWPIRIGRRRKFTR